MKQTDKINKLKAWIVLATATGVNMTIGTNYSWSVIKKALVNDWQWSNVDASLPLTIYTVIFSLAVVFAGRMQDNLGPRLIVSLGGILTGTGLIACSFTRTPLYMMLPYGLAALGNGVCYASTIPVIMKWFPAERKGFATGIVVSGIGMASVYFSPLSNWLLGRYGIEQTFLLIGIGASAIMLILAQFLSNPPATYQPQSTASKSPQQKNGINRASSEFDWHQMISTLLFYKLWFMYFFAASAGLMIIGHIATIAKTQAAWEKGFYLVMIFAIFNTIGRLVAGFLSDKYGRRTIMAIVFLLQAVNLAFFINYATPATLTAGVIMIGLCYGACFALFPLATSDFFGTKNFGINYGLIFLAWGCAGILGPILAGWAVDKTGTYFTAYIVSAFLLLVSFFLTFTISPPAIKE